LDPRLSRAYVARGYCRINTNDYEGAIADENQAILLSPENPTAYRNRGIAHFLKKDFDEDIFDQSVAIRMDPNGPEYYFDRSLAWDAKGESEKAIADASSAIRLNPKLGIAYSRRAEFRGAKGDFDGSISDFSEAIRLAPKDPEACNGIAWDYAVAPAERNRDGRRAMEYATRACEVTGWKEPWVLDTLAAACAEVGNFDDAVKWENKALELKLPKDEIEDARARLALYLQKKPYRKLMKPSPSNSTTLQSEPSFETCGAERRPCA
jgi:tetratricopeptide (TPR) repeat protein